jgi:hypothetical protein
MPWGSHKGKQIGEVPFDYLFKYYKKQWLNDEVLRYVEDCLSEIEYSEAQISIRLGKEPKKYLIAHYECVYGK